MKSIVSGKWAGIMSVVWLLAGFFTLKLCDFHTESPILRLLFIYGAWWGGAVLLAVTGIKSRFIPSAVSGSVTIILLVSFLWITAPRGHSHPAPVAATMTQIATFRIALDAFRADTGFYPTGARTLYRVCWSGPLGLRIGEGLTCRATSSRETRGAMITFTSVRVGTIPTPTISFPSDHPESTLRLTTGIGQVYGRSRL
jgi:hypothetical protein